VIAGHRLPGGGVNLPRPCLGRRLVSVGRHSTTHLDIDQCTWASLQSSRWWPPGNGSQEGAL